jgi:hypothetical protein
MRQAGLISSAGTQFINPVSPLARGTDIKG